MSLEVCLGRFFAFLLFAGVNVTDAQPSSTKEEVYQSPPEAEFPGPGVPQGRIEKRSFVSSTIFPGTTRDYWVYLPAGLDPTKGACLMVHQDGQSCVDRKNGLRVPNVYDHLIHEGAMPVTVGLFVNPGIVPGDDDAGSRYNRSFEYDEMGPRYARFLIQEMIPAVEREFGIKISRDPNDCGIAGASSGAIAAFTVAWQRPDQFRRVFSSIGTYVGLRGGADYPTLIRKTEPKPLRVFLQDGENDLNNYAGDWWMANQTMLRALQFSGYEVNHEWGKGGHERKQEAAIFPKAMRWLWDGHRSRPVKTHFDQARSRAPEYLVDGAGWELVSDGHEWAEGLAVDAKGNLYFADLERSEIFKMTPAGEKSCVVADSGRSNGLAMGPDGRLYGCASGVKKILAWDTTTWEAETIAEGVIVNDLVILHDHSIYFTDPQGSRVCRIDGRSRKLSVVDEKFIKCNGIGVSPDQRFLYVADFLGCYVYSYRIAADGTLAQKQAYFNLELDPNEPVGHNDGLTVTKNGLMLIGTKVGVQICDQVGRVQLILPVPAMDESRVCYVAMGGPHGKTLYAATSKRVWKRETQMEGAFPWQAPVKPPKPKL
jgi:gluconolactonase